jgi:hypothetical protein
LCAACRHSFLGHYLWYRVILCLWCASSYEKVSKPQQFSHFLSREDTHWSCLAHGRFRIIGATALVFAPHTCKVYLFTFPFFMQEHHLWKQVPRYQFGVLSAICGKRRTGNTVFCAYKWLPMSLRFSLAQNAWTTIFFVACACEATQLRTHVTLIPCKQNCACMVCFVTRFGMCSRFLSVRSQN